MKRIIFLICSILFFVFAFIHAKPVQTDLLNAFVSPRLAKLANVSAKKLNIVIESDNPASLEDMKSNFPQKQYDDVVEVYKNYPQNFLSGNTKKLILDKNYKELDKQALERLYNPFGIYIASPDRDPYLLATDFVLSKAQNQEKEYKGKFYSVMHIDADESLMPELLQIQKNSDGNIYFTGAPVHSYYAKTKSVLEINIICIISTLALILLCRFYFKSFKILIPIGLSIIFGMLLGYSVSSLIFKNLHVLTFVFSTSLIGISLDYSLHYFLTGKEPAFKKNLTASMLTTVLAFSILIFSKIEILRQIAVFTSCGLIGVYLFVTVILTAYPNSVKTENFPKFKLPAKLIITLIAVLTITGLFRIKFNDSLKNLYVPPENLVQAEKIYQEVFHPKTPEFIMISGKNTDVRLEKEENLNLKNYTGLSSFISSSSMQKKNLELVSTLYKENLQTYEKFLGGKVKPPEGKIYDVEKFPLNKEFTLDENTSFVMVSEPQAGSINPAREISDLLKKNRIECLVLLPVMFAVLFIVLNFTYGIKKSAQILTAPLCGALFAAAVSGELNLFNILALFLIPGFSIDYSIFRMGGGKKSKDAVFMSFASTAFSFLLLSFTGFKVISSLGFTLFCGITASYILSLFVIKSKHEK